MSKSEKIKNRKKRLLEKKKKRIRVLKNVVISATIFGFLTCPFLITGIIYRTIDEQSDLSDSPYGLQYVQIGTYPQTMVEDPTIIAALSRQELKWTYYTDCCSGNGFYGTMRPTNCMKYADIEFDGNCYRAVMIEQYRPDSVLAPAIAEESHQDDNGFQLNKTYWFCFEPINWIVLNKNNGFILSEKVLDAMPFNDSFYWVDRNLDRAPDIDRELSSTEYWFTPANLYKTSSIRKWLNNCFFAEAFSKEEKKSFKLSGHLADEASDRKKYGVLSLNYDKIFLPSLRDVGNCRDANQEAVIQFASVTDYARCRGGFAAVYQNQSYSWHWLCSPGDHCADVISIYLNEELINFDRQFFYAYSLGGIRCAANLKPDFSQRFLSEYE